MSHTHAYWLPLAMSLALMGGAGVFAAPDDARPPPPPEAVAACRGKAEGATASFIGRGGETVAGECRKIGDLLAVLPAGGPGGGRPPPR